MNGCGNATCLHRILGNESSVNFSMTCISITPQTPKRDLDSGERKKGTENGSGGIKPCNVTFPRGRIFCVIVLHEMCTPLHHCSVLH